MKYGKEPITKQSDSFEAYCTTIDRSVAKNEMGREGRIALRQQENYSRARYLIEELLNKPVKEQKVALIEMVMAILVDMQRYPNTSGKSYASILRLLNELMGLDKVSVQADDTPHHDEPDAGGDVLGKW